MVVHVVEDDDGTRVATARLLEAAGYAVRTYPSGTAFLDAEPTPGCVLLDLQLPDGTGLDVQRVIAERNLPLPVVFLSGHAEVPDSVEAMKAGAVDFLVKSVDGSTLLETVARALARQAVHDQRMEAGRVLRQRYAALTPREREVFAHLISGQLNKQVGFDLGISLQTTKIHRHRVLTKMQAESIVQLARMGTELGVQPVGRVR